MAMELSVVAFIDVLGFSAMVKTDAESQGGKYLDAFREVLEEVKISFPEVDGGIGAKMFSDSIVLAAPLSPGNVVEVLRACANLQRRFLKRGILLRGGVSYGKHYADSTVMFSEGLISAYHIESQLAKYPRIVVDKNVIDYFVNHSGVDSQMLNVGKSLMIQDRDRVSFVHYLSGEEFVGDTAHVEQVIVNQLEASESVLEKLRWLHDYHLCCADFYNQPKIDAPDWFKRMQIH